MLQPGIELTERRWMTVGFTGLPTSVVSVCRREIVFDTGERHPGAFRHAVVSVGVAVELDRSPLRPQRLYKQAAGMVFLNGTKRWQPPTVGD